MKKKLYLTGALLLAVALSGGVYASTYTTASAPIGATAVKGNIATVEPVVDQPGWDIVLDELQQEKQLLRQLEGQLQRLNSSLVSSELGVILTRVVVLQPVLPSPEQLLQVESLQQQILELQQQLLVGEAPIGELFEIYVNQYYSGDLVVKVYITNAGALSLAYQDLNLELTLTGSEDGTQLLTLNSGVATFTLTDWAGSIQDLTLVGDDYRLISDNPLRWGAGWTVTPEFYCEVIQG